MIALVVGHGRMGRFHSKILGDLGYEVLTVDPQTAADYTSTEAALQEVWPNVAAIACPAEHLEAEASKLIGVPMLVEKPFAPTRHAALRLALRLGNTPCCVGFIERFNPQVRALRHRLQGSTVHSAHFVRQSIGVTPDPLLDLAIHDVDLAHHLHVPASAASFEASYGGSERSVTVAYDNEVETVDLRAHGLSPLHALWHRFLIGGDYPVPLNAVMALGAIERLRTRRQLETARAA